MEPILRTAVSRKLPSMERVDVEGLAGETGVTPKVAAKEFGVGEALRDIAEECQRYPGYPGSCASCFSENLQIELVCFFC